MFKAVFTKDKYRFVRTQATVKQRLAYAPCRGERLRVGEVLPFASAAVAQLLAPSDIGAVWRLVCPMQKFVGHALWVWLQWHIGQHILNTVVLGIDLHAGNAIAHGAVLGCSLHLISTLAARPCKKASTRALASGAAWVMEDISDSVTKPWSAVCSAMRGRACIKA